ncbi:MAG: hypothetical protein WBX25_31670 [Rhodomicrobium sp.]
MFEEIEGEEMTYWAALEHSEVTLLHWKAKEDPSGIYHDRRYDVTVMYKGTLINVGNALGLDSARHGIDGVLYALRGLKDSQRYYVRTVSVEYFGDEEKADATVYWHHPGFTEEGKSEMDDRFGEIFNRCAESHRSDVSGDEL